MGVVTQHLSQESCRNLPFWSCFMFVSAYQSVTAPFSTMDWHPFQEWCRTLPSGVDFVVAAYQSVTATCFVAMQHLPKNRAATFPSGVVLFLFLHTNPSQHPSL
jgi:hypothetical protein